MKEKILFCEDAITEKLAHEIAMICVEEDYKRSKRADMIVSCKDEGWMLNHYYQAKYRAICEIKKEYEITCF